MQNTLLLTCACALWVSVSRSSARCVLSRRFLLAHYLILFDHRWSITDTCSMAVMGTCSLNWRNVPPYIPFCSFISAINITDKTLSLCLLSILITKRKESVTTGWTVACITLLSFLKLRCSHWKEPNRSEEHSILSISRFILINPWFPLYRFAHLLYMYIFLPIWL